MAVPMCRACRVLCWLGSVRCTAVSLCGRWFLAPGKRRESSGNHSLPLDPACLFVWKLPAHGAGIVRGRIGKRWEAGGRREVGAGLGRGLTGGDKEPQRAQLESPRPHCEGGEGRGEMRSGRYQWVGWAPGGTSHPRVRFYTSQSER